MQAGDGGIYAPRTLGKFLDAPNHFPPSPFFASPPLPLAVGCDGAGDVVAVGSDVKNVKVGDR